MSEKSSKFTIKLTSFLLGVCVIVDYSMALNLFRIHGGCTHRIEINIGTPGCHYDLAQAIIFEAAAVMAIVLPIIGSQFRSGFLHFVAILIDAACIVMALVYIIAYRANENWTVQSGEVTRTTFGNQIFLLGIGAILLLFHVSQRKLQKKRGRDFVLN